MQNYLKPNIIITFQEQVEIFSFRSEMNEISFQYQEPTANKPCEFTKELNNHHLYECTLLNNGLEFKFKYENILNGTIHDQNHILNILKKNLAIHIKMIWHLELTIDWSCLVNCYRNKYIYISNDFIWN